MYLFRGKSLYDFWYFNYYTFIFLVDEIGTLIGKDKETEGAVKTLNKVTQKHG